MNNRHLHRTDQRTNQVQHIIEKMPTRFGFWISMIVLFLFVTMIIFGWIVRYPDIITGEITINSNSSPLKLIANTNGKLKLNGIRSLDQVREGQILGYIENSTNPINISYIDSLLKLYQPNADNITDISKKIPHNFSLGELNIKYYAFRNALQEFINYKEDKIFDKQKSSFSNLLSEQHNAESTTSKRVQMAKNSLNYAYKFFKRDSILFSKKVISEAELDKSQMSYLAAREAVENALNSLINTKQSSQQTESKIQEIGIQKPEKEKELRIALIASYNDLVDNIKTWHQKYVFRAAFNGHVQFLKFFNENQFVQAGEPIFSIVPDEKTVAGQLILPSRGAGKIKVGQEVIVKLEDYPYLEYGSITGRVSSISITSTTVKTDKNDVETYMVLVDFPSKLTTNYGANLGFRAGSKGQGEVITNDRRFIHRLFDNLKYVVKK
ncbi:HlyD family secretion protein [Pedobacter sp. 22163]|uniref:HlyD family secretion protein n=1 Tax=Pedobacter sp. 22163 TaxID=3453883 RepID=UPI003F8460CF